jgi:hypothetical protein
MLNAFMKAAKTWGPKLLTEGAPALLTPSTTAIDFRKIFCSEIKVYIIQMLEKISTEYPGFTFEQILSAASEVNFHWKSHHVAVLLQASLN